MRLYGLTVNYLTNHLGFDTLPRFSYKISDFDNGDRQASRRITVKTDGKTVWDSAAQGQQELFIPYAGENLLPLTRYEWRVEVTSEKGETASASAFFVTGKRNSRWNGKWISAQYVRRENDAFGAVYLRKVFTLNKPVRSAYLAICGLGYFESRVNGIKTGDDLLSPAFTEFSKNDLYLVYDVKDKLVTGENALTVTLGNGMYNCFSEDPWNTRAASWRHWPKLLSELHVTYEDGSGTVIPSDTSWKGNKGPIVFNGLRNGEHYDARLELGAWTDAAYDDSAWDNAKIMKGPGGVLENMEMEPIRVFRTFSPVKKWKTEKGWAFDFGQNMAGFCRWTFRGKAGSEYSMHHSDMLKENGELDLQMGGMTRSHGFANDQYIKKSDEPETWQPIFTYHGFQYAEIEGCDYEPDLSDVTAMAICSDCKPIGHFECSDPLLNNTQRLCFWSTVSNLMSIPTDNPHREKNGWTGDTSLSCEQMLMNFDVRSFLGKWSRDMHLSQRLAGQIPCVVPSTGWGYYGLMGPDWSSALIMVPWNIYLYNADMDILRREYDTIKRNCDFMESMTDDLTLNYGTGDWCPPFEGEALSVNMGAYKCPVEVSDTAFFHNAAMTVVKIAEKLGYEEDIAYYSDLAARIRKVFREKFFDKETYTVKGDCQTATGCMLFFGLYEEDEYLPLVDKLISQIREKDWHLDFGVLGNKFVMHALGASGHGDIGCRMIAQRTFPGCQRWMDLGATTLWECWNGKGSHNHHMFSDLSAFMYRYIGGISPDEKEPGFQHILLRPAVASELTGAKASHESMYGTLACEFKKESGTLTLDITVPFGCTADLYLPKELNTQLGGKIEGHETRIKLTSGKHVLKADY